MKSSNYSFYIIENVINGYIYVGITNNPRARWAQHKNSIKSDRYKNNRFVNALKNYGISNFTMTVVDLGLTKENAQSIEVEYIKNAKNLKTPIYNVHAGGHVGNRLIDKLSIGYFMWKFNNWLSREGKKPALGMKHTEANKKLFSEYGKRRWDIYERYPDKVTEMSFIEANRMYGISKTQYYRLKRLKNGGTP